MQTSLCFPALKGLLHPKMKMLSFIYLPPCRSKPVKLRSSSEYNCYTCLCLDTDNCLAVNGTVTSLKFIQNILNCVSKTNEVFTGLERHGGK